MTEMIEYLNRALYDKSEASMTVLTIFHCHTKIIPKSFAIVADSKYDRKSHEKSCAALNWDCTKFYFVLA